MSKNRRIDQMWTTPTGRYALGVFIVLAALLIRFLILPVDGGLAFLTFYPAMAVAALICGSGPALMVSALGGFAGYYIFTSPVWAFKLNYVALVSLSIYVLSGAVVGALLKRNRQSEGRYARLSELTFEGIIIHNGKVAIDVNTSLCRMFQYEHDEMVGQPFLQYFVPEGRELCKQHILSRSTEAYRTEMVRKDGSTFFAELRGRDVEYKGETMRVACIHDITVQKQLEDDLLASQARFKELARTDPLTGLANRRTLTEVAEHEFQRSKRFGASTAVLMIDIDHFKKINDTYGHDAGDVALVNLARMLQSEARSNDLAARLGGEEFVFLLIETELTGALDMAERIRTAASRILSSSPSGDFKFSVSIGVTTFKNGDNGWSDALTRADAAMYEAKHTGRNKAVAG